MKTRGCESVGIDLGTTYSALAYMDPQLTPRIVSDSEGHNVTPSVVYFDDAGIVVGETALQQAKVCAERVAQFIKVHMGDNWRVEFQGHEYTPESLSAIVLRHLVRESEPQIGPIQSAVITVPAYFTEKRRRATEQAGIIAGLDVIGTLNEPMAATLAYGLYRDDAEQTVVVYDLGGGTFDVTVVHVTPREICELATCGNRQLGGRDWDRALIDHVAEDFRKAHELDPRDDPQAAQELQLECERVKRNLSRVNQVSVRVNAGGKSHVTQVTRELFEQITSRLLHTTRMTTEMALEDAGKTWADISRVALVGGSTQMPAVRRMLKETSGLAPDLAVNPVMAVALGAAIYAHMLEAGDAPKALQQTGTIEPEEPPELELQPETEESGSSELIAMEVEETEAISQTSPRAGSVEELIAGGKEEDSLVREVKDEDPVVLDETEPAIPVPPPLPKVRFVTAHGVGVRTRKEGMWKNSVLIPKNSRVPSEANRTYYTSSRGAGGSFVKIVITQGDTPDIDLAEILGEGRITGFPANEPPGQPVDVTMRFDETGRLHVRAVYASTGQALNMSLDIPGSLQNEDVRREREHLEKASFLTVFDPDQVLAGLDDEDVDDDDDLTHA